MLLFVMMMMVGSYSQSLTLILKNETHLSLQSPYTNLTFCIFSSGMSDEDVCSVECHGRKKSEHFLYKFLHTKLKEMEVHLKISVAMATGD